MARNADFNVAFLPIKPRYAQAIMAGEKRVEFRKTRFARDVRYVVVYSSSPEKVVLGYFAVKDIDVSTPAAAWRRYSKAGSIQKRDFISYYDGADQAVTIVIQHVHRFDEPLSMDTLKLNMPVPQSYAYLSRDEFRRISSVAKHQVVPTAMEL